MANKYLQIIQSKVNDQIDEIKIKVRQITENIRQLVRAYWFKTVMLGILVWMFLIKDVSINLNLKAQAGNNAAIQYIESPSGFQEDQAIPQNTSLLNRDENRTGENTRFETGKADNPMNTYSNLPFSENSLDLSESELKKLEKIKKQKAYVKKYSAMAKEEMKTYGIPASITLAQGLLESNAGESKLAVDNNNHFGLKCFSRQCKKGHCSNFTDDSHKDFFKIFKEPADSYHAHSKLLKNGSRYFSLFKIKKADYKGWAKGLKKAGYATDPNYDKKLIRLIEELKLYKYDK